MPVGAAWLGAWLGAALAASTASSGRVLRILLFLIIASIAGSPASAQDTARTAGLAGWGPSYWGPIAPAADSLTVASRDRATPLWESALVWPYRVITFPLVLIGDLIGAGVQVVEQEKVIPKVRDLITPVPGPFGLEFEVAAGGLTGFGVGATGEYRDLFGNGSQARLRGATSSTGHHLVNTGLLLRAGDRGRLEIGAGYRMRPNARYFGIGPETVEADQSFYRQETGWAGVGYHRALARHLDAHAEVLFTTVGAWDPRDQDDPPLQEHFPSAIPPGFGEYSSGVSFALGLTHDDEDQSGRPIRGGARRLRAWYFASTDGTDAGFWNYRAEVEQLIPLWYRYHVLAVRGFVSWIEPRGSAPVPFQRLMTNYHPDVLRGYDDLRWRDRGMTVVSAEYRWPLWVSRRAEGSGLDLYLLGDLGQVFGTFDEIGGSNLSTSWGAGLRLGSVRRFTVRLEVARSEEGTELRLQTSQLFQFQRRGLYYGRDPVPHR